MAKTQMPPELDITKTMVVGGETNPDNLDRLRLHDYMLLILSTSNIGHLGLELEVSKDPVVINILAKFGGKDFLKLSDAEAGADHLVVLGVPDFSRKAGSVPVPDEHGQLPNDLLAEAKRYGLDITLVVSKDHTKENWMAAITRSNPKIITL